MTKFSILEPHMEKNAYKSKHVFLFSMKTSEEAIQKVIRQGHGGNWPRRALNVT